MDINNFGYIPKDIMNIIEDYNNWKIIYEKSFKYMLRYVPRFYYCDRCGGFSKSIYRDEDFIISAKLKIVDSETRVWCSCVLSMAYYSN